MSKSLSNLTRDEYHAAIAFENLRDAIERLDSPGVSPKATQLVENMLIDHQPDWGHDINELYANIIAAIKAYQNTNRPRRST